MAVADACDNPTMTEVETICRVNLKLPTKAEPEAMYSRDYLEKGRVRVAIKTKEGKLLNDEIPSRMALWRAVGRIVPTIAKRGKAPGNGGKKGKKNKKKNKKKK